LSGMLSLYTTTTTTPFCSVLMEFELSSNVLCSSEYE